MRNAGRVGCPLNSIYQSILSVFLTRYSYAVRRPWHRCRLSVCLSVLRMSRMYRVVQKRHKVYGTIILQPYTTESCGFQQNVPKEILYVTKVSI